MIEVIDRVPSRPGRYLMIMPDGSTQYVTLTRADEPTVVGTPINKELFDSIREDITELNSNFAIQIYRATDFVASGNKVDLNAARSGNIVNLVISIPGSVLTASQETLVATMTKLKPRVVQAGIGYHSSGMTLCKYHITKDGEVYITPESGTAYYTVSLSYISEDY